MGKAPSGAVIGPVNLQDGPEAPPLYRQVYLHIRRAILGGTAPRQGAAAVHSRSGARVGRLAEYSGGGLRPALCRRLHRGACWLGFLCY